MQNSGLGNAVNPLLSLADSQVYKIPVLLLIGWRGEPGVKDEPQHITQGELTLKLLETMKIPYAILENEEEPAKKQVSEVIQKIKHNSSPFAIVIRKKTFEKYVIKEKVDAGYTLSREDAIKQIVSQFSGDEVIVSTTGKTSRELFECRAALGQPHSTDFLTVGSMGHASQIALGIALAKPNRKVVCFDGDGAMLMHMGAMSVIGNLQPKNFLHILINNGAHESVGGQPTVAFDMDIPAIAKANNYKFVQSVSTKDELIRALQSIPKEAFPALVEVKVKVGARDDLGRPTIKPVDNKVNFMKNLGS
jgi:phosphonopyruvate decarboxylase